MSKHGLIAKLEYSNKRVTLSNQHDAIFCTKPFLEENIRQAYFGGRTELYVPQSFNGYIVDINSLYPYCLKKEMPYGSPVYNSRETRDWTKDEFNSFYGFLKIDFITPPNLNLLPVLPRRYPKPINHNVYALGIGNGWYFISEIKLALSKGYKIRIKESIKFNPNAGFSEYVDDLYNLREKYPKGHPMNLIAKNLLNSSYGRYGIVLTNKIQTQIFDKNTILKKQKEKIKKPLINYLNNGGSSSIFVSNPEY